MRHLDDGLLRRMHDDPLILSRSQREHYHSCSACRERYSTIAREARESIALFDLPPVYSNHGEALRQLQARIAVQGDSPKALDRGLSTWASRGISHIARPLSGIAAAAIVTGALALTPAGSYAQQFVSIFQPSQVAVVPITSTDLRTLPNLAKYGTMHVPRHVIPQHATTPVQASTLAGMSIMTPHALPSDISRTVQYQVLPSETGSFTFSAKKARAAAVASGKPMPVMPAGIDGSTLSVTSGTAAIALYGDAGDIPSLVVGQMKAPTIRSTGVGVKALEDYMLSLPGVSTQLANAIRSIGDPTTTLPLPIPTDMAHEHTVDVQGVRGVAVGDATGLGSIVIWQKDGMIHGVGGPMPESEALNIANSLG